MILQTIGLMTLLILADSQCRNNQITKFCFASIFCACVAYADVGLESIKELKTNNFITNLRAPIWHEETQQQGTHDILRCCEEDVLRCRALDQAVSIAGAG